MACCRYTLHPDEWLDGALLPSYHTSLGGAETYFYQNHPVITELYRRHHARELNFVGTVATIASADNFDRERNCRFAANLVRTVLKADAAILTKFGGGVPHTDLSETARFLEGMGIKTAVQVTDLARDRRVESALLFNFPEVNAIVCIGGNSTSWKVPRAERVIAASRGVEGSARRALGSGIAERRRRRQSAGSDHGSVPWFTNRLVKKPHMLRCACSTRFNVLKRTPQLIELRAPCL